MKNEDETFTFVSRKLECPGLSYEIFMQTQLDDFFFIFDFTFDLWRASF